MSDDFKRALEAALTDMGSLPAMGAVTLLSSPSKDEVTYFTERLRGETAEHKRALFETMVNLAENSFHLDFTDLYWPFLHDPDAEVRRHAIEGLWEDERADLVPEMLSFLASDPAVPVRAAAALSLGRLLWLVECDELPMRFGSLIETALRNTFDDISEDIEVRRRSLESIAYVNEDWVRQMIDRAYQHEDERMRVSAVFAMGRNADKFWTETVLAELDNEVAAIRFEAARAAGEMQLRRAVATLIRLVEGGDAEVQEMAIWALGQIGGRRARAALERYATSEDEAVSDAANEALEEIEFSDFQFDLMAVEGGEESLGEFLLDAEDLEEDDEDGDEDGEDWEDDALDLN